MSTLASTCGRWLTTAMMRSWATASMMRRPRAQIEDELLQHLVELREGRAGGAEEVGGALEQVGAGVAHAGVGGAAHGVTADEERPGQRATGWP